MRLELEQKEITVTEVRNVTESLYCDVCKRLIYKRDLCTPDNNGKRASYWEVTTGHNDWGNDSIESRETFCLCSPDCLQAKFTEYVQTSNNLCASDYLEVEHHWKHVMEHGDSVTTHD